MSQNTPSLACYSHFVHHFHQFIMRNRRLRYRPSPHLVLLTAYLLCQIMAPKHGVNFKTLTWSSVQSTFTCPVGSISISTAIGVMLSDGGTPSIIPPISRKSSKNAFHCGYSAVLTGCACFDSISDNWEVIVLMTCSWAQCFVHLEPYLSASFTTQL